MMIFKEKRKQNIRDSLDGKEKVSPPSDLGRLSPNNSPSDG